VSRFLRAAAVLAAAAGLTMTIAIPASGSTVPLPARAGAAPAVKTPPSISISASSQWKRVDGAVYVSFLSGQTQGTALITGTVFHARAGEQIRLFSQSFPFTERGTRQQTQPLAVNGSNPYTFEVKPRVATRYTVELFRRNGATKQLARSGTRFVYVVYGGATARAKRCGRPTCHQAIKTTIRLPVAAFGRESVKPWFVYIGVRLGPPGGHPATPKWLRLDTAATVSPAQKVDANSYQLTLSFSFQIGNHSVSWIWTACTQDTESADGIGLPGHHGCSMKQLRANHGYLG
jgi:hypothetical protein